MNIKKIIPKYFFVLMLFFASGFSALIYQVAWQRSLYTVLGGSIESVTVVVAIFMLGLGFGSLAGGYLSKLFPDHTIITFSLIEIAAGFYGVISLTLISAAPKFVLTYLSLTAFYSLLVLLLPTLLMGASLPLLSEYIARKETGEGRVVAILYLFNTLGASLAAVFTAFVLFELFGLSGTVYTAAFCNLGVGIVALFCLGKKS